jgi:MFS family permease
MLTDLAPLRDQAFRRYWTGQSISSFGDGLTLVVNAFAVLKVGGSAATVGIVLAAGSLCRILSALAGGVTADRYPRRIVLMSAECSRCVIQAAIGALLLIGTRGPWFLLVGSCLYGTAAGFFGPASTGILPSLVSKKLLKKANALQSLSRSGLMIIGPGVAGLLIADAGVGAVYLVDSASFAVNVLFLWRIRVVHEPAPRDRHVFHDLAQGWHEVIGRRWLSLILLAHAAWNFGFAAFLVIGPVVAARQLGGPVAWGIVSAGMSVGLMIGSAVALRWNPGRPLLTGNLALTLGAAPLLALAARLPVPLIAAAAALSNAGVTLLNALWYSTLQRVIPQRVMSRVMSYDWLLSFITLPAGLSLAGVFARLAGDGPTLAGAAIIATVPAVLTLLIPAVWRLTSAVIAADEEPSETNPDSREVQCSN